MNKKQIRLEIETITHITFDLEDRLRKLTEKLNELKVRIGRSDND